MLAGTTVVFEGEHFQSFVISNVISNINVRVVGFAEGRRTQGLCLLQKLISDSAILTSEGSWGIGSN